MTYGKLQQIAPKLEAIRARFEGVEDPSRFQLRDEVRQLFKDAGLVTLRRIPPGPVCIAAQNRFGQGVLPARVVTLLNNIFGDGFSLIELDEPWAAEMPPKMVLY